MIPPFLRRHLPASLLRGMAAFGGAEMITRIVRVLTTLVIARQLAPAIVGEAALALTLFELIGVLWGIGIGQHIIAAEADALAAVCNRAHGLFWHWSAVLMAVQLLVAGVLWLGFGQGVAAAMLAMLALVYPLMPGGLVQCHLAMREGRHGDLARTAAAQAIADQLLTAALLLAWPGPWAVTLPKLLTAPIWLVMTRRNRPWQPDPAAGKAAMPGLFRFGAGTLAADALGALRQNGDNLIIAATMGSVALGSYYFAFNAGLGIVTALANAFGTVILPILGRAEAGAARAQALRSVLIGAALLFVPLVAAQSLLAPWYVPLLFGAHWAFAAPLAGAAGGLVAGSLAAAAITLFTALRPGLGRITPPFLLSKETPA